MKFDIDDSGLKKFDEAAAETTKEQYRGRLYFAVVAAILAVTLAILFLQIT